MLTKSNPFELMVSDHHGIYVPQVFAETVRRDLFGDSISPVQYAILRAGPDDEFYWEVWDEVLMNAETSDGTTLHQDGDLWAVNWSLIGDPDELDDLGAVALAKLKSDDSTRELIGGLYASLLHGPVMGFWSDKLLSELRNRVESVADEISSDLPKYWSTDLGIEEHGPDVEQLLIAESPALTSISRYW